MAGGGGAYPNDGAAGRRKRGSGQWRRWVWGPTALVWKGEERISSNLGMAKLGGRSPERGKTAAALDKI
jgi:hypothetical protein